MSTLRDEWHEAMTKPEANIWGRLLLVGEDVLSEIPGSVVLTNYRLIRTDARSQADNRWRVICAQRPAFPLDVWLKDILAVTPCKTNFPTCVKLSGVHSPDSVGTCRCIKITCGVMLGLSILGVTYTQVSISDKVEVGLYLAQFAVYLIAAALAVIGSIASHLAGLCTFTPEMQVNCSGFRVFKCTYMATPDTVKASR